MHVFLDSCIIIYLHEGSTELRERVWSRLSDSGARVCVSDLSRLECRVAPLRSEDSALLEVYDRFFGLSDVDCVELTRDVFDRAAELRARHVFRTPDALHLAAAMGHGCQEFWTNDLRLVRPDLGITVARVT